ncbi:unnamed protein product [Haemonchus placei]|uniref:CTNNB1_binding domain-containing protein n=1 Tax=Haemonchus placei TaxID=6290 RepID=A0A0N4WRT3_HAEPC|nr:unnamed protein product [Haemonchus placei]
MEVVSGERSTGERTKAMVAGSPAVTAWSGGEEDCVIEDEEADPLLEPDDEEETASTSRGSFMFGNEEVSKEHVQVLLAIKPVRAR